MLYTTFLVSLYFDSDPPTWSKVCTFPLRVQWVLQMWNISDCVRALTLYYNTVHYFIQGLQNSEAEFHRMQSSWQEPRQHHSLQTKNVTGYISEKKQIQCIGFSHDEQFYSHRLKKKNKSTIQHQSRNTNISTFTPHMGLRH